MLRGSELQYCVEWASAAQTGPGYHCATTQRGLAHTLSLTLAWWALNDMVHAQCPTLAHPVCHLTAPGQGLGFNSIPLSSNNLSQAIRLNAGINWTYRAREAFS